MGDVADMMLEGVLCCECGVLIEARRFRKAGGVLEGTALKKRPGYPVPCEDCQPKWPDRQEQDR